MHLRLCLASDLGVLVFGNTLWAFWGFSFFHHPMNVPLSQRETENLLAVLGLCLNTISRMLKNGHVRFHFLLFGVVIQMH